MRSLNRLSPRTTTICWLVLFSAFGCNDSHAQKRLAGAGISSELAKSAFDRIVKRIEQSQAETLAGPGLIGVRGGVQVKALQSGVHELQLPMPLQVDSQVPLAYGVHSPSHPASLEYQFQQRDASNQVLVVTIQAKRGEQVTIEWAAVVLIGQPEPQAADPLPQSYCEATACAQADATTIQELAEKLWPADKAVEQYAHNIQNFVGSSKPRKPPRTLDALAILESGNNAICTANANLAVALLRAKGIPARSLAVIPPTGQRLEMHRIVELEHNARRQYFDPSGLHATVPLQPWQTVIMAKTTIADEQAAMVPRMGVAVGSPYGQEAEFPNGGLAFSGQDFFWTVGSPLAEFASGETAYKLAIEAWAEFLKKGVLSAGQLDAVQATNESELAAKLGAK